MSWAGEEFQGVDLGDKRRDRRAVRLIERLAERRTASIPGACNGWRAEDVADARLIDRKIARNHFKGYQPGGLAGVLHFADLGSDCGLDAAQLAEFHTHLQNERYLSVKGVADWVEEPFGFLIYRQRHDHRAASPGLRREEDQAGARAGRRHGSGSAPRRGRGTRGAPNTGRRRLDINGVVELERVVRYNDIINAASTSALVDHILLTDACIDSVCDNARHHRSVTVSAYLHDSRIKLLFLPVSARNLNPIERLWQFLKEHVRYTRLI